MAGNGGSMQNATNSFGIQDASPSISKVLQDLTNKLPNLKEIQPSIGGKENTPMVMANQLLPNSSIAETITPTGESIGDDELSNLICELSFEKLAAIYV
jgi:hypothetical protein